MRHNQFALDEVLEQLPQTSNSLYRPKTKTGKSISSGSQVKLSDKYVEVKKNQLSSVPIGTYLRYIDSDGNLKPGGGKLKSVGENAEGENVVTLNNFNMSTKKYYVWSVKLTDISKIYRYVKDSQELKESKEAKERNSIQSTVKQKNVSDPRPNQDQEPEPEPEPETAEEQILSQLGNKMLFNDNELLKQKVDSLELEVHRIDTDLKKIFMLVKRIHAVVFKRTSA